MVITHMMLIFLFIEGDNLIKVELMPPIRLEYICKKRALPKSLHEIVWRIAKYAPNDSHGNSAQF